MSKLWYPWSCSLNSGLWEWVFKWRGAATTLDLNARVEEATAERWQQSCVPTFAFWQVVYVQPHLLRRVLHFLLNSPVQSYNLILDHSFAFAFAIFNAPVSMCWSTRTDGTLPECTYTDFMKKWKRAEFKTEYTNRAQIIAKIYKNSILYQRSELRASAHINGVLF
jgi:hypothetical protein